MLKCSKTILPFFPAGACSLGLAQLLWDNVGFVKVRWLGLGELIRNKRRSNMFFRWLCLMEATFVGNKRLIFFEGLPAKKTHVGTDFGILLPRQTKNSMECALHDAREIQRQANGLCQKTSAEACCSPSNLIPLMGGAGPLHNREEGLLKHRLECDKGGGGRRRGEGWDWAGGGGRSKGAKQRHISDCELDK